MISCCSAIDKLDKEPWEAVRAEMVDQKGLPAKAADAVGRYVRDDVEPKFQGQPEEVSFVQSAEGPFVHFQPWFGVCCVSRACTLGPVQIHYGASWCLKTQMCGSCQWWLCAYDYLFACLKANVPFCWAMHCVPTKAQWVACKFSFDTDYTGVHGCVEGWPMIFIQINS